MDCTIGVGSCVQLGRPEYCFRPLHWGSGLRVFPPLWKIFEYMNILRCSLVTYCVNFQEKLLKTLDPFLQREQIQVSSFYGGGRKYASTCHIFNGGSFSPLPLLRMPMGWTFSQVGIISV